LSSYNTASKRHITRKLLARYVVTFDRNDVAALPPRTDEELSPPPTDAASPPPLPDCISTATMSRMQTIT
jgi:hypothetical protein